MSFPAHLLTTVGGPYLSRPGPQPGQSKNLSLGTGGRRKKRAGVSWRLAARNPENRWKINHLARASAVEYDHGNVQQTQWCSYCARWRSKKERSTSFLFSDSSSFLLSFTPSPILWKLARIRGQLVLLLSNYGGGLLGKEGCSEGRRVRLSRGEIENCTISVHFITTPAAAFSLSILLFLLF